MSIKPVILQKKTLAKTRLFHIEGVHVQFSNGEERHFERIAGLSKGPIQSVMILPLLRDDTLLLIREYGVGLEQYVLGFPKGAVDINESAVETAQRELKEEVGYGAHEMEYLTHLASSPAYVSATMEVYVARNLYRDELPGDEPEPLEVVQWPMSDVGSLLSHPEFIESRSIAALCHLMGCRSES